MDVISGDFFQKPPPERICPCCRQKIRKLNPHRMDKQKVRLLEIMLKARIKSPPGWIQPLEGGVVVINDERLSAPYRARAHASRLVWFGLAEHDEERRSGMYRATLNGLLFMRGQLAVPEVIYCKEGEVVERAERQVLIGAVKDVILDKEYWDSYPSIQKWPEES